MPLRRQNVGKTVKVTILPTPTPRSAGERRRRPLQMCSLTFQKKWQWCGLCMRFCAPRQDHRVGIRRQDRQDLGRGIGQVPEDAERPQVPLFVLCHCGRQIAGKTVKVTVLPTSTPRSAGERRRRPLHMCSLTFQRNGSSTVWAKK